MVYPGERERQGGTWTEEGKGDGGPLGTSSPEKVDPGGGPVREPGLVRKGVGSDTPESFLNNLLTCLVIFHLTTPFLGKGWKPTRVH